MLGTVLEGRYVVERELGAGGMARVYLARDVVDRTPVAVKVLHATLTCRCELTARLRREAMAAARVGHPNVVGIRHVGVLPGGEFYLAMDYLDGVPLDRYLDRQGPLPAAMAARLLGQLAAGLEALHAAGVVHRDVKPANVMIVGAAGAAPCAVLMDLGLASVADLTRITATGTILGTPSFMAPEQLEGLTVGPPADVYAFGLVAYTVLTGRNAYDGHDLGALLAARQSCSTPKPTRVRPELAAGWDALVASCVEPRPEARASTASSLVMALRELEAPTTRALIPIARQRPARRRSPVAFAALTVLVGTVLGLGLVRWRRGFAPAGPVAAPPAPVLAQAQAPALVVEARTLAERLRGWRADRAMAGVVDALLPSPLEFLGGYTGGRNGASDDRAARVRLVRARTLLESQLAAEVVLPAFRHAAAVAPRVFGAGPVSPAGRVAFLASLRPFLELRYFADARGLDLPEALLPHPDLGWYAVRTAALPGRAREAPLVWPGGAAPPLGHRQPLGSPSTVDYAEATVTLPSLEGVARAELCLAITWFETWPLVVRVGRGPEILVGTPYGQRHTKAPGTLYVGLSVEHLDAGPQRVVMTCPALYGYFVNAPTSLGACAVRLVAAP